ncbi:MAG TPA: hypothetical protein VGD66_12910 [Allosphingosinicella sp.]|jgi:hypothetical protein
MNILAFILAAALAPPAAPPPPAPRVKVTGRTIATPSLVPDVIEEVRHFSTLALKCDQVTAARASALPRSWTPADPNFRIGPRGTRYERWDVTLCGRAEPFLLGFWNDPKAGPQFQVGHPFPAAARPRRR